MIRTKVVKLTLIPAVAYRQKLQAGGSGITILRADSSQPGIASISRTSGEAIPSTNTNKKLYPVEAFKEAMELTKGLPYKKQNGVKVTKDMVTQEVEDKSNDEEYVVVDSADYQKIVDKYTDKNGKFSYDLLNKDFIRFAKSSSVVRDMIAEGKSAAKIRNYVVSHKIRNITGNDDLTDKQIKQITDMLNETSPKGVYKELDAEIRRMLSSSKKKGKK